MNTKSHTHTRTQTFTAANHIHFPPTFAFRIPNPLSVRSQHIKTETNNKIIWQLVLHLVTASSLVSHFFVRFFCSKWLPTHTHTTQTNEIPNDISFAADQEWWNAIKIKTEWQTIFWCYFGRYLNDNESCCKMQTNAEINAYNNRRSTNVLHTHRRRHTHVGSEQEQCQHKVSTTSTSWVMATKHNLELELNVTKGTEHMHSCNPIRSIREPCKIATLQLLRSAPFVAFYKLKLLIWKSAYFGVSS